jgi:hypothetical protein
MEQKKNSKSWQPEYTAGQRGNPGQASIHDDGSIALKPGQPESTAESTTELTPDCRRIGERRKAFWRSLLYGNFRPRRRSSRRTFLALAVLLLSCTDALFTLNLLNLGATEANIVMALALEVGIDQFVQIKIILTSLSVVVLVVTARRIFFRSYRVEHALQLLAAAYLMVISYELYIFNFVFEFNLLGGV